MRAVFLLLLYAGTAVILSTAMYKSERGDNVPYLPQFPCISYNPFHNLQLFDPDNISVSIDKELIREDLLKVRPITRCIRLYTTLYGFEDIVRIAEELDIQVILGAYLYSDKAMNQKSMDSFLPLINRYNNIKFILVGNETQLRNSTRDEQPSLQELLDTIDYVKQRTRIPVSTAELHREWLNHPEIVAHVDFIGVHIFPFWSDYEAMELNVDDAIASLLSIYDLLKERYPDKEVLIMETGWATSGQEYDARKFPSVKNSILYYEGLKKYLDSKGIFYNIVEAFDQPWKRHLAEGDVGSHWGIFDAQKELKTDPTPFWFWIFAAMSVLTLIVLFFPLQSTRTGYWVLVFAVLFLSYYVVGLARELTQSYFFTNIFNIILLTPATLLTIFLVLYRLVEYLEQIYRRPQEEKKPSLDSLQKPFISVHVPCSNEPSEQVIACLETLRNIDYPQHLFEIIVIDNNTQDKKFWKPLESYCQQFEIKFSHIEILKGYKAGALNYALTMTDPKAELIAVVDSDYRVSPDWLSDAVSWFDTAKVAGVQYPQDYITNDISLFQRAIYLEYKSFFSMGMIVRDRDNAVIQHGTMLLLRRAALTEIGGWNEKSVVEDTELGLRLQSAGHVIRYVDKVMGRGILPSSFQEYARQRVRWVFGASRIFLDNLSCFSPFSQKLTFRQKWRYLFGWLPWLSSASILFFLVFAVVKSLALFKFSMITWPFGHLSLLGPFFLLVGTEILLGGVAYYIRVDKKLGAIFTARLAGAALSFAIMRGIVFGFIYPSFPFRVTNKSRTYSDFRIWLFYSSVFLIFLTLIGLCFYYFGTIKANLLWVSFLVAAMIPIASALFLLCLERKNR